MLQKNLSKLNFVFAVALTLLVGSACTPMGKTNSSSTAASAGASTTTQATASNSPIVAGQGSSVTGVGALTCPTAQSIVAQVQTVLGVSITSGNTGSAYTQLSANLPATSDCTKAVGFDNAQLFIYAACSDLTTGKQPAATSKFNVTLTGSVASQQTALIAAGLTILNGFTGGIAGSSTATAGITTALTNLLTSATPPATSTVAFMDVCIAATSAGALLISN